MAKGKVTVRDFNRRLQLRWSYKGKRYEKYTGLSADVTPSWDVAEAIAKTIEADMATMNFDYTLEKYFGEATINKADLTVVGLFDQFIEHKKTRVCKRTLEKYYSLSRQIKDFFHSRKVAVLTPNLCEKFINSIDAAPITLKNKQALLIGAWDWAVKDGLVDENPWREGHRVKVPPKQPPKPFTREEVGKILTTCRNSRYYAYYYDFISFRLATGCRPGEAAGLRWKHLRNDCSNVWIGESETRSKDRGGTKNLQSRSFDLPKNIQAMLLNRRPPNYSPDDLIFPSPSGKPINDKDFRNRCWQSIMKESGIDYRKPYNLRHTAISHMIDRGESPAKVAEITGHDPEVLFKYYFGSVEGKLSLPDIWD
ncbi:MAG: tyrosine-type recombinase/integrase [Cyanobacteria bacterium P01_A01_bin.37]